MAREGNPARGLSQAVTAAHNNWERLLQLWMSVLYPRMGQEGWAEGRGMSGWGGALDKGLLALIPFGFWRQSSKNEA